MSGNKISDRPILPLKARKAVFEKLEDIADVASMSPEDRERYDNSVKVYRDYLVTMDAAEQKGMKEGMEKGIKEGAQKAQLQIATPSCKYICYFCGVITLLRSKQIFGA